jgi:hypothetical protein
MTDMPFLDLILAMVITSLPGVFVLDKVQVPQEREPVLVPGYPEPDALAQGHGGCHRSNTQNGPTLAR